MLITTIPWHITGLMGQPRRVAIFDYSIPLVARTAALVITSVLGGLVLLIAAILLIIILVRSHFGDRMVTQPLRYALAVNPPQQVPAALNGFALWNAVLLAVMVVAYGYPIGQFFFLKNHSVPAVEVTSQERGAR
jgi:cytochrome c oxidase subunit 1